MTLRHSECEKNRLEMAVNKKIRSKLATPMLAQQWQLRI